MQSSSQIITTNKPTSSFLQARCPSCRPTNSAKALKEKYHIPWTFLPQAHLGSSNFVSDHLTVPGYLGEGCHASHQPSDASIPRRPQYFAHTKQNVAISLVAFFTYSSSWLSTHFSSTGFSFAQPFQHVCQLKSQLCLFLFFSSSLPQFTAFRISLLNPCSLFLFLLIN